MEAKKLRYEYFKDERDIDIARSALKKLLTISSIILSIFLCLCLFLAWNFYMFGITGSSMQPTLNQIVNGQEVKSHVYISRLTPVQRNDIFVLWRPTDPEHKQSTIIKRCIATSGDYVSLKKNQEGDYHVYLKKNGSNTIEMLEEDYIYSKEDWNSLASKEIIENGRKTEYDNGFYQLFIRDERIEIIVNNKESDTVKKLEDGDYYYKVPEGCYFYLGDHRGVSADARSFGIAKTEHIFGKVVVIYHDLGNAENRTQFYFRRASRLFDYIFDQIVTFFAWN